jgi:DNA modification methylase
MTYEVHTADCLDHMRTMADNAVDAVVTDPPYGLTFMGKDWDKGVPGEVFWREALRVSKPGAHLLAFGGTRTFHRLTCAIEDAGWEIRDCIMWVHSQGFPKSLDVSKAIDKAAGAEREVVGPSLRHGGGSSDIFPENKSNPITAPATDLARKWQGWGTCIKPAFEPIIMARKPLDGTVASTVAKWGTGGLNVDGCRVGTEDGLLCHNGQQKGANTYCGGWENYDGKGRKYAPKGTGRFPANLVHDGSEEVLAGFPVTTTNAAKTDKVYSYPGDNPTWSPLPRAVTNNGDSGSAARFFYCSKASTRERNAGMEPPARNIHATVKPISLMRWLVRLVTPPDGLVLDPFTGSGTTGCAAVLEGKRFIGCELSAEYAEIARARIAHHAAQGVLELEEAT